MKKILYFIISLTVILLVGCNTNKEIPVPDLKVSTSNVEISVLKGSYEWNSTKDSSNKQAVHNDSPSPEIIAESIDGDKVNPQSELILNFSLKPNKVKVIEWGKLKDSKYTFTDEKITVPNEEGTYIYEVFGEWEQGHVSYTLKVLVRSEQD